MADNFLVRIFEHNNWANQEIIQACSGLNDEQLDAVPQSATKGSIRRTLIHLVGSQEHYLELLTMPVETRSDPHITLAEINTYAKNSGAGLLALAQDPSGVFSQEKLHTADGYLVDAWVIMLQAINHATEHREQIKSMLSALGLVPPNIGGWDYGEVVGSLIPVSS